MSAPAENVIEIDFRPFWQQVQFILSMRRQRAAVCGARGGKTALGLAIARDAALVQEGYAPEEQASGKPYNVTIGTRTFPWGERVIIGDLVRSIPRELQIKPYSRLDHTMRIRGQRGVTDIQLLSYRNPQAWFGEKIHFCWVDEFCLMNEGMYDEIQTRLTPRVGQPAGQLVMTGTPQGPNWAYHRIYLPWEQWQAMTPEERESCPKHPGADIDFFTWKTVDNPYIDRDEIERARHSMPPRFFARQYLATWDSFAGMVYEEFAAEIHVKRANEHCFVLPSGRIANRRTPYGKTVRIKESICGVDWGFGEGHPGAALVLCLDDSNCWWAVEESLSERLLVEGHRPSEDSWLNRFRKLRARWEISKFYCDHNRPENMVILKRAGLPVELADKEIVAGIQCVSQLLHVDDEGVTRFFLLDTCKEAREEIVLYHWQEGKELPAKVRDHLMDAKRYALYTHLRRHAPFDRELGYRVRV